MITRRRRQGSESEQLAEQVLKGPSSPLLWAGEYNQPSVYLIPPSELGTFTITTDSGLVNSAAKTSSTNEMALAVNPSLASSSNVSRDRTAEFLTAVRSFQSRNGVVGRANNPVPSKNTDQHQQYSEFMKVAK